MWLRALVFLLAVTSAAIGSAAPQTQVAVVAAEALSAPAPEDAGLQVRTFSDAYSLLLDNYVHPLDTSALLKAAWGQLTAETAGKAAAPGPPPTFSGDRAADLDKMRDALSTYLKQPDATPDGFVPVHALIRGMVRYVDEGHTYFLDPQQYTDYQSWSRGDNTYVGIGISVSTRGDEPHIVEVYDDTPARQAGLQSGDVLVKIDGKAVAGMALDQMTALVRGPAGTAVELTVRRGADELVIPVQRAEIHLPFVKQKVVEDDIGYVSLRGFPEPSVVDTIEQDVASFRDAGVRGLVLDLRGNSGGRIDVGTRLLGHFLPAGTSIYEEVDKSGGNQTHVVRGGPVYDDLPLVVLVDGATASMGEIFASAVQEHGVATVLGSTTSGSVAAAQVFALPDGAGIQVTVFDILSADGKPLNKVGVLPDEVIDPDPATVARGADPVLNRAVELLHEATGSTAPGATTTPAAGG